MAEDRNILIFKDKDELTNYVYEDVLSNLYDCGILMAVTAVLKDINDGTPLEEIRATLEDVRKDWTEKLAKTEFGRDNLEAMNRHLGLLETEDKEEQNNGESK